jgi:uncharacterized membrane protein HdeD (DUF308 family)
MRSFIKTSTSIVLAAVLAAATLAPSTASAQWRHGGMHGHGGWGGPVAFGLFGLAAGLALSAAANQNSCVAYRDVYDGAGNYLGQQAFNVC